MLGTRRPCARRPQWQLHPWWHPLGLDHGEQLTGGLHRVAQRPGAAAGPAPIQHRTAADASAGSPLAAVQHVAGGPDVLGVDALAQGVVAAVAQHRRGPQHVYAVLEGETEPVRDDHDVAAGDGAQPKAPVSTPTERT